VLQLSSRFLTDFYLLVSDWATGIVTTWPDDRPAPTPPSSPKQSAAPPPAASASRAATMLAPHGKPGHDWALADRMTVVTGAAPMRSSPT